MDKRQYKIRDIRAANFMDWLIYVTCILIAFVMLQTAKTETYVLVPLIIMGFARLRITVRSLRRDALEKEAE